MEDNNTACSSGGCEETENSVGFEIDTTPTGKHERVVIPDYECKRKYKLSGDCVQDLDELQAKKKRNFSNSSINCWNCGQQGHNNRECPQPVRYENLARNRKQFMNSRPVRKRTLRYHTDNEQKYSYLRPGILSSRLQKALGIGSNQVPRHIYNMRNMGYPPGWLEEAKVLHSGITLIDAKGSAVADPDDEEGEVVDNVEYRNKYDLNKLVEYPGFNSPLPQDVNDVWQEMNFPPMKPDDSLENLIETLRPNEAKVYHKKKVPVIPSASPPREININAQNNTEADMECEETPEVGFLPNDNCGFIPALPEESLPPPPPPALEDGECSNHSEYLMHSSGSPTLLTLEEQKKSILENLNNTDSSEAVKVSDDIKEPSVVRVQSNESVTRIPSPNLGRMKSEELGTPILKSVSPYSKLPSSDSFSQNICDVINFENLPDSTGIYDKMLGVLSKVRTAIKRMQRE